MTRQKRYVLIALLISTIGMLMASIWHLIGAYVSIGANSYLTAVGAAVAIDLSIVTLGFAVQVLADEGKRARWAMTALAVLVLVSVMGNVMVGLAAAQGGGRVTIESLEAMGWGHAIYVAILSAVLPFGALLLAQVVKELAWTPAEQSEKAPASEPAPRPARPAPRTEPRPAPAPEKTIHVPDAQPEPATRQAEPATRPAMLTDAGEPAVNGAAAMDDSEAASLELDNRRLMQDILDNPRSSQQDRADRLGMSQSTISRRLREWKQKGWVVREGRQLSVVVDGAAADA